EADDADDGQAGVPVDRHLAAIGPPPTGGGRALHPLARRVARHDRTTPYSLGSGAPATPPPPLGPDPASRPMAWATMATTARNPMAAAITGTSPRRHPR